MLDGGGRHDVEKVVEREGKGSVTSKIVQSVTYETNKSVTCKTVKYLSTIQPVPRVLPALDSVCHV